MALERITHLTAPPVLGRWYLVPTVEYVWLDVSTAAPRPWPVFLPKHDDREHLNFPWPHYHVDPRFLRSRDWQRAISAGRHRESVTRSDDHAYGHAQRVPLMMLRDGLRWRDPADPAAGAGEERPHGPVIWRRMRCARVEIPYQFGDYPAIRTIRAHYAGRTCKHARGGLICPHKRFPLGSLVPDADGVVTCPLHGLRVDVATGKVVADAR